MWERLPERPLESFNSSPSFKTEMFTKKHWVNWRGSRDKRSELIKENLGRCRPCKTEQGEGSKQLGRET